MGTHGVKQAQITIKKTKLGPLAAVIAPHQPALQFTWPRTKPKTGPGGAKISGTLGGIGSWAGGGVFDFRKLAEVWRRWFVYLELGAAFGELFGS